jgi:hypothetical protein
MASLLRALGLENGPELWRSEEMQLVQLMVPSESARDTVAALGEIGMLQIRDLNVDKSAFQRTYATQVRLGGRGSSRGSPSVVSNFQRAPASPPCRSSGAMRWRGSCTISLSRWEGQQ